MSPEKMASFGNLTPDSKAVISITETETPLFITGAPYDFAGNAFHLMATIIHNNKTNTIEIRSRLRNETTGRKNENTNRGTQSYTPENLEIMKTEILSMYTDLVKDMPYLQLQKTPFQISFEIGEDVDSIIQKMNDSNEFDIGITPNKT